MAFFHQAGLISDALLSSTVLSASTFKRGLVVILSKKCGENLDEIERSALKSAIDAGAIIEIDFDYETEGSYLVIKIISVKKSTKGGLLAKGN